MQAYTDINIHIHTHRHIYIHTAIQANIQASTYTDKQAYRQQHWHT